MIAFRSVDKKITLLSKHLHFHKRWIFAELTWYITVWWVGRDNFGLIYYVYPDVRQRWKCWKWGKEGFCSQHQGELMRETRVTLKLGRIVHFSCHKRIIVSRAKKFIFSLAETALWRFQDRLTQRKRIEMSINAVRWRASHRTLLLCKLKVGSGR